MPQNTSEKRIIDNITQQLRLLGAPSKYVTEALNPVFLANDDFVDNVRVVSATRTSAGTTALLSTTESASANGTFWITHIALNYTKNTLQDLTATSVSCTINGTTAVLLELAISANDGLQGSETISFPKPIKIDAGTAINFITTGAGTSRASVGIIRHDRPLGQ